MTSSGGSGRCFSTMCLCNWAKLASDFTDIALASLSLFSSSAFAKHILHLRLLGVFSACMCLLLSVMHMFVSMARCVCLCANSLLANVLKQYGHWFVITASLIFDNTPCSPPSSVANLACVARARFVANIVPHSSPSWFFNLHLYNLICSAS